MYRIRRFGVVRTATVIAVAYAIVFALLFLLIGLVALAVGPRALGPMNFGGLVAIAVVLVVLYPLLIWVAVAIGCLIYNLAARWVGGIEIEVDRLQPVAYPPAGYPPGGYPYTHPYGQPTGPAPWAPTQPPAGYPGAAGSPDQQAPPAEDRA